MLVYFVVMAYVVYFHLREARPLSKSILLMPNIVPDDFASMVCFFLSTLRRGTSGSALRIPAAVRSKSTCRHVTGYRLTVVLHLFIQVSDARLTVGILNTLLETASIGMLFVAWRVSSSFHFVVSIEVMTGFV